MAQMNLAIRGIEANLGSYNADTFFNDCHPTLRADYIMANPPFNLSGWGADKLKDDVRWQYGLPPAGNANFAWLQHMIYHLAPNGKIGMVLANGALSSQSGGEGEIRKNIVNADLVECIVFMPVLLSEARFPCRYDSETLPCQELPSARSHRPVSSACQILRYGSAT